MAPGCRLAPLSVGLILVLAVLLAGGVPAGSSPGERLEVISTGARPFTDSLAAMVRRDRARGVRPGLGRAVLIAEPRGEFPDRRTPAADDGSVFTPPPFSRAGGTAGRRDPQTVAQNFAGINLSDQFNDLGSGSIPPDTMGAVGPSHFVQIINSSVAVYNKTGTRLSHVSLNSFFTLDVGGTIYPRNGGFDPRVLYDRRSGHWFATAMDRGNPSGTNNHIVLAVSRTSDPTGTWDKYLIPVGVSDAGATTSFTDYSTLGTDENGVYFGMTIFPSTGGGRAKIAMTGKTSLIAGSPSLGDVFQTDNITDMYSSPQPAHNLDGSAGGRGWLVSSSTTTFGNINYRTVTWNGGVPTLSATFVLFTAVYASHGNAPASGSSTNVNTGDDRLQMAVIRSNRLWTCRTIGVNNSGGPSGADRAGCEWLELNVSAAAAALVQSGRVFDTAVSDPRFYYYPSVMVSGQGHAAMGFSGSKLTEFVGAYTCGRLATDDAGAMQAIVQYQGGLNSYTRNDGIGRNRWGDYSYTSLDPNDDMSLWTIQEYAESTANIWGTRVARLRAPAPTLLNPNASGAQGQTSVSFGLTGTGLFDPGAAFANRSSVSFSGAGISNAAVTVNDSASATVTLHIAGGAATGPRNLTFTNPDGQFVTVNNAFTVNSAATAFVQFASSTFSVAEGGIGMSSVTRSGDTSGTSTVTFSTSNGTADSADYSSASEPLNFAPGDTSEGFSVTTLQDNRLEGSETVTIALSNPIGAAVGSPGTSTLTITDDLARPAPSSLTAIAISFERVDLSWTDNCDNEDGFRIERSTDGGATFALLTNTAANATTHQDTGLSQLTRYDYRIRASKAVADSTFSNTANATTLQAPPAAPSGLGAIVLSTTSIRLNWTDNSADEASFKIERSTDGVNFSQAGTVGAGVTLFTDTGLAVEGLFTYRVRATNPGGDSGPSNTVSARTLSPPPSGLTATGCVRLIEVSWADNSSQETGFQISRQVGPGSFDLLATVGVGATTFTDTNVSPDTSYTYFVKAMGSDGNSEPSNQASASTPADTPTGKVKVTPRSLAFGKVKVGVSKLKSLTIQNTGKVPITVCVTTLTAPFGITAGAGTATLAPKQKLKVTGSFTPTGIGAAAATFRIFTTLPSTPQIDVGASGTGK